MKFLHSWLQEYIEESIPKGEDFVNVMSTDSFEVEEWHKIKNHKSDRDNNIPETDYVYDLNVLPNRAHDCLGHYFMAREVATIFNLTFKKIDEEKIKTDLNLEIKNDSDDFIKIQNKKDCTRFIGVKVNGIEVKNSPEFIKYRLENIGEKSINNIVDITNYVQFTYNKPLHVYDAEKVNGFLEVRNAKENEKVTTLDNKELELDEHELVISDKNKVLGLAGVKGGKDSGIINTTTDIILESANFNPVSIRKTSRKYNIKTTASKRFENGLADNLCMIGALSALKLLKEYGGEKIEIRTVIDNFPDESLSNWQYKVSVSIKEINNLLGTNLDISSVENILNRYNFDYKYISSEQNIKEMIPKVLGVEYKNPSSMRADALKYFSCSSLISYLYEGVYLPSLSIDKYLYTKDLGSKIENIKDLKFGDLIFRCSENGKIRYEGVEYKTGEKVETGVDHVGIYLGEGKVLHSSKGLVKGTEIEELDKFCSIGKVVGFGRVLENMEEQRFVVTIPSERLDLRIKEDIIEEIARVYGLNNIKSVLPKIKKEEIFNQKINIVNTIKSILVNNGFSEIMTYSLKNKGDIKIIKSVAQDKNYLRNNLASGMEEALKKNIFNLPLLHTDQIKTFEIGNIFTNPDDNEKEEKYLCIGIEDGKKNKNYIELKEKILKEIKESLNVKEIKINEYKNEKQKENCFEINLEDLFRNSNLLKNSLTQESKEIFSNLVEKDTKYTPFALTPFIVRDIAVWVEGDIKSEDIRKIIDKNITKLCISVNLFDEFEKEIDGVKKKSYGFRLVYQDKNRTLTDEEVNVEAEKVYQALKEEGLEIR